MAKEWQDIETAVDDRWIAVWCGPMIKGQKCQAIIHHFAEYSLRPWHLAWRDLTEEETQANIEDWAKLGRIACDAGFDKSRRN